MTAGTHELSRKVLLRARLYRGSRGGAVLSGAIFGDRCSPVSDATVIGVIAVLYVIFGFTELSPFILLGIGIVALYFLQIVLHKFSMKKYNIDPNYTKFMTAEHKKV